MKEPSFTQSIALVNHGVHGSHTLSTHATHSHHCDPHRFCIQRGSARTLASLDPPAIHRSTSLAPRLQLRLGHLHGGGIDIRPVHAGLPTSQHCRIHTHSHPYPSHVLQSLARVQLSGSRQLPGTPDDYAVGLLTRLRVDWSLHAAATALSRANALGCLIKLSSPACLARSIFCHGCP